MAGRGRRRRRTGRARRRGRLPGPGVGGGRPGPRRRPRSGSDGCWPPPIAAAPPASAPPTARTATSAPCPLPKRAAGSWPEFFATRRLLPYLKLARDRAASRPVTPRPWSAWSDGSSTWPARTNHRRGCTATCGRATSCGDVRTGCGSSTPPPMAGTGRATWPCSRCSAARSSPACWRRTRRRPTGRRLAGPGAAAPAVPAAGARLPVRARDGRGRGTAPAPGGGPGPGLRTPVRTGAASQPRLRRGWHSGGVSTGTELRSTASWSSTTTGPCGSPCAAPWSSTATT